LVGVPLSLTLEQVATLAPDASSLAAGRKLASGRDWRVVGHDERALWGECQGSALYQVRVDLADLTAKCSCPSRKFPCKHALGLMLKAAGDASSIATAAAPDWVEEWLARREAATEKREQKKAEASAAPVDEKAQARRAQKRATRVDEGLAALDLWIADLVRTGLATIADQGAAPWHAQAARMVDAQAPGIAARLRRIAGVSRAAPDWARRVLAELARISLLTEAYSRLDALDAPLRDDVRALIGWTLKDDEVIARGEASDDHWLVVGQRTEDEDRLRVQRTWLLGLAQGRHALVLQFAAGAAPFAHALVPGTVIDARLRYWPAAHASRALIEERRGTEPWQGAQRRGPGASQGAPPTLGTFDELLRSGAAALAAQPWVESIPCVVRDVRPARADADRWLLVDAAGAALPLASRDHRKLVALSGGHPIAVAGEWDGDALLPLAAIVDGRLEALVA
jgi:hypothetical protein